jgi:hypothetical protein
MTSPSASGKTSLIMLYMAQFKAVEKVIWVSFLDDRSSMEILKNVGIDLRNSKVAPEIGTNRTIVFIDDAHRKFDDIGFWETLIKYAVPSWLPKNIRFVIVSTYLPEQRRESRYIFRNLNSLNRNDFLLKLGESEQFLDLENIGLPPSMRSARLKQLLIHQCGGLIGALRVSAHRLSQTFSQYISSTIQPEEHELLDFCLSQDYMSSMSLCFGGHYRQPTGEELQTLLGQLLLGQCFKLQPFLNSQDELTFKSLIKSGVLFETNVLEFEFSSPLARRYYSHWIFGNRSSQPPTSLRALISDVISSMSSSMLIRSTVPRDFPKEAALQIMFWSGLAKYTPPQWEICSELSKAFPDQKNDMIRSPISAEIDLFLYGNFRWGIELLIKGDRIGEHMSRFQPSGKYYELKLDDYIMVDLRPWQEGDQSNIYRHENKVTVFFSTEYDMARCIFGLQEEVVVISLAQ